MRGQQRQQNPDRKTRPPAVWDAKNTGIRQAKHLLPDVSGVGQHAQMNHPFPIQEAIPTPVWVEDALQQKQSEAGRLQGIKTGGWALFAEFFRHARHGREFVFYAIWLSDFLAVLETESKPFRAAHPAGLRLAAVLENLSAARPFRFAVDPMFHYLVGAGSVVSFYGCTMVDWVGLLDAC